MISFLLLFGLVLGSAQSAELFHYYAYTKSEESLQNLIEREFVASRNKEVNYAFYLKVMKENSRLKNFEKLPKNERIYFRLPKVIVSDDDKSKVSFELSKVQKFYIDDLVTDQEAYNLKIKLAEYLYKKSEKKRMIEQELKQKLEAPANSRAPASSTIKEDKKTIHDYLREEEEFILQHDVDTTKKVNEN